MERSDSSSPRASVTSAAASRPVAGGVWCRLHSPKSGIHSKQLFPKTNQELNVHCLSYAFCIIQFSSVTQSCLALCDPMNHSTLGFPVHHQLLEFTQTHVHRVGDAIQPSYPLSSSSPPAPNPSQHQGLFQWVNSSHEVAKVLEFQLQHQIFQWTSGLISFRMDWLDLLTVQGTLKSLLQHHSSKASILWCSAFFIVQLSHTYMTTGKT